MVITVFNIIMIQNNSIVQNYNGVIGRVVYKDNYTYMLHVLVRLDTFSWKIEKWDIYSCNEIQGYLWTINTAFACRYYEPYKSPDLRPMDMEID